MRKAKILGGLSIIIIVLSSFGLAGENKQLIAHQINNSSGIERWYCNFTFSHPEVSDNGEYVEVNIKEANSFLMEPGKPMLPIYSIVAKFPLGTKIIDVTYTQSEIGIIHLTKKVAPAPQPQWLNNKIFSRKNDLGHLICISEKSHANSWYSYKTGGGIDNEGHVTFLSIHFYPVKYLPEENILQFVQHVEIKVTYEEPSQPLVNNKEYQLVIITPSRFAKSLQSLVDHKNEHGIATKLVTLDEIYEGKYFVVEGRDDAEKIKHFIKNAIEQWGISYVMLVGDIDKMPIRKTWFWDGYFITDLYYADIYDANGNFCSWDSNGNGYFGEYLHDGETDFMDLYPDVYIGRLACENVFQVKTVVNKIIKYEEKTYGAEWFNRLILCGGDTFPGSNGIEGEYMNRLVAENMSDFTPVKLWPSEGNLTPWNILLEINKGAGFVHFSGHGSPISWATHPPNSKEWIGFNAFHIPCLINGYKLPIIFLDACSTAELDFELAGRDIQCFAWDFIKKIGGGAIATIGSTRVAYSLVTRGGAGYLGLHFFLAYDECSTPAEMLVKAQNDYLNNLWKDGLTIEEFILLGDPTLRVGGYHE